MNNIVSTKTIDYVVSFKDEETLTKVLPLLQGIADIFRDPDGIVIRKVKEPSCEKDAVFEPWVDVDQMVSILSKHINYQIYDKQCWAALYCVMRELKIIHPNCNKRMWVSRVNVLFADANVECSYDSMRKLCDEKKNCKVDEWDELDKLYSPASCFMDLLINRQKFRLYSQVKFS